MGNRRPEYLSGGWPGGPQSSGPGLFPQTCFRWRGSPLSPSVSDNQRGEPGGSPCGCLSIHQGPRLLYEVHKRFRNRCSGRRKGHDHSPGGAGLRHSSRGHRRPQIPAGYRKLQGEADHCQAAGLIIRFQHRNFGFFYPPGNASDARAILEQLGIPPSEAVSLVNAAVEKTGPTASPSEIVRAAMKARS